MLQFILFIAFGIIMMIIASSKGFSPVRWLFAAGLLGLIVLLALPSSYAPGIDETEKQRRIRSGNNTGTGLSIFAIVVAVILVISLLSMDANDEEIRPVVTAILILFAVVSAGVITFIKIKKVKLDKGNIAAYIFTSAVVSFLIFFAEGTVLYELIGAEDADIPPSVFIVFGFLETFITTYLLGLLLWYNRIHHPESQNNVVSAG
jgi:hypothetical protein